MGHICLCCCVAVCCGHFFLLVVHQTFPLLSSMCPVSLRVSVQAHLCSRQGGPSYSGTVAVCSALVCTIIDQRVMEDEAWCASVDCFAVRATGSRIVVSLQTAKAL